MMEAHVIMSATRLIEWYAIAHLSTPSSFVTLNWLFLQKKQIIIAVKTAQGPVPAGGLNLHPNERPLIMHYINSAQNSVWVASTIDWNAVHVLDALVQRATANIGDITANDYDNPDMVYSCNVAEARSVRYIQ